ncbi:pimeloyl-CoA dehydrogenase large subunit [Diaphorobacter sp. HDW4A]|uniref:acyl-CoA dehydrogenase family protein n=1 Tax=Diaphorobacter sp. HDW4A TaxID=2714924 RepID=UPI00140E58A0|nr:acyl-CoA dehydrogenase family protein [Diaphorobacter sp. HDW4A]QIL80388.1 pimeloyl-CoA dehydrogenase large subunit [Diaphorobacter sp. HDW4A]
MNELSPKAQLLGARVREFMQTRVPPDYIERTRNGLGLTKDEQVHWHNLLDAEGWLVNHWPVEWGGPGWSPMERYVFDYETAVGNAPRILPFGVSMLAPVILRYGSDAQKQRWLPRIRSGADWWCQGYSEPGAGSDLASLKTSAVRNGEHYIVNGQKTWTTFGQHANMMFCLVRTDRESKPQEGISFLLIDMRTPGIEVRPLYMLNGEHEVNEVFLNDVRVPVENLIGEENRGWDCAKYLLTYERTGIAGVGLCISLYNKLRAIAAKVVRNGRPLIDDPLFRQKLAKVWMDLSNLKETNLRILLNAQKGGVPGPESSVLKILGTEIRQELFSLLRQAAGSRAVAVHAPALADFDESPEALLTATDNYFNHRKLSIFGGSNEVQKNILSKFVLGL